MNLTLIKKRKFANGIVYALKTKDGFPIEVTDTFLPFYTRDAINEKQNKLQSYNIGSRKERWMIGVSVMSGCPVGCKFCATGKLKKCHNLTSQEIIDQIEFILNKNPNYNPSKSQEFKINYTRMGEPFLNINEVKKAIKEINKRFTNTHHYISTVGIKNSDFSWIKNNITLQFSVHSFRESYRDWLIPFKNKMTLKEMGEVRTKSNLKTTLNLTLVNPEDFDIVELKKYFDPKSFFVKLSPINPNEISNNNKMDYGIIDGVNLI